METKGSPVGSQHLIIVLEKSGAGRGCEGLSSQQWPEKRGLGGPLYIQRQIHKEMLQRSTAMALIDTLTKVCTYSSPLIDIYILPIYIVPKVIQNCSLSRRVLYTIK